LAADLKQLITAWFMAQSKAMASGAFQRWLILGIPELLDLLKRYKKEIETIPERNKPQTLRTIIQFGLLILTLLGSRIA